MIDYNRIATDCRILSGIFTGMKREAWAEHELSCRDAIMELMAENQSLRNTANGFNAELEKERANNSEYCLGQIPSGLTGTEAKGLREAGLYVRIDGKDLMISQLIDRLAKTEHCLDAAVKLLHKMDEKCELCAYDNDPDGCEASDFKCAVCKSNCRCRDCKENSDGRSKWEFAGWDRVLQEN